MTGFANSKDNEVKDRLNAEMSSKFIIKIEAGQNQVEKVMLDDGSYQSVNDPNFDINNPKIVGVVVNWNETTTNSVMELRIKMERILIYYWLMNYWAMGFRR